MVKRLKIHCNLGTISCLGGQRGDIINETNIYRVLGQFADVYYNNQKLNFSDKKYLGTCPSAKLSQPKEGYDLYYVRGNPDIFTKIKGKKIYFCSPYDKRSFDIADGIVYITDTWARMMDMSPLPYFLQNIYPSGAHVPKRKIVFNQVVTPRNLKNHPETKALRRDNNFIIGCFGATRKSNYPNYLFDILYDLPDKVRFIFNLNKKDLPFIVEPGYWNKNKGMIMPRVDIIPSIPFAQMPYAISACDALFYNFKINDGDVAGALRVLDAMSYGVPIFCSRKDARVEELGRDYELFFSSPMELFNKIKYLIDNPQKKEEIGNRLLKRAEYYNIENSAKRYKKQLLWLQ